MQPGYPLRTLLRAIAGQVDEFAADIGQLYDNWFIETCDDDLVPYFAELVGLSLGPSLPTSAEPRTPVPTPVWRRAQVADAIADRQPQGLLLGARAAGGPGHRLAGPGDRAAPEWALATQSVRMPDIGRRRLIDLADAEALELLPPRCRTPHRWPTSAGCPRTAPPGPAIRPGWPCGYGAWSPTRSSRAPAASAGDENRYTFDQLGRDLALAVIPPSAILAARQRPSSTSRGRSPAAR